MKNLFSTSKKVFITSLLLQFNLAQAQIPSELLHQAPKSRDADQVATIQGDKQTSTALKFINAQIYITYINNKATLAQEQDSNQVYRIQPGQTELRYISNAQNIFSSGHISFNAKAGQQYQIKNDQAKNKSNISNQFWIENINTGEKFSTTVPTENQVIATPINFSPVIISK